MKALKVLCCDVKIENIPSIKLLEKLAKDYHTLFAVKPAIYVSGIFHTPSGELVFIQTSPRKVLKMSKYYMLVDLGEEGKFSVRIDPDEYFNATLSAN